VSSSTADDATLVLLHPVGLDGASFSFLGLPHAATPNLLGHGGRPRSAGMTLEDVADDVAATVPGDLDVAGFSFGGMVAVQLALRHPERVRSLLVVFSPAAGNH
jgi:pimeloyl-ACP methyl ester carboxylesterase